MYIDLKFRMPNEYVIGVYCGMYDTPSRMDEHLKLVMFEESTSNMLQQEKNLAIF